MADIFISYAQEDGDEIQSLVALLESQGWSVFWDRNLLPGDNWTTLIEQKLAAAKAAIVVWSQHSATSEWVKAEAMAARERGILVPVRIDQVSIPLPFGGVQTADISAATPNSADNLRKLVMQLGSLLSKAPTKPEIVANFAPSQKSIFTRVNWLHYLFELDGRLSRRVFWLGLLFLFPAFALLQFAIEAIVRATQAGMTEAALLQKSALVYMFVTLYPTVAIAAKRLHDFNWSAWWTFPAVLPYVILTPQQALLFADPSNTEANAQGLLITLIILAPLTLIALIPGNRGANRFGMPPP